MDGIAHHIIVHLSLIPSIGASIIQRILQQIVPTQLSTLYSFSVSEWQALGFSYKVATALHEGMCNAALLERELVLLQREGVQVITCLDEAYPPHLRHIHLPPPLLYYRGNIDLLTNKAKRLAVVGSRNATSYAQRALNALLPPLIKEGVIIVSGGARGVDAMAHSVTLNSNGATIAVVGSGFLHPYPRQHTKLFDAIASSGLLISPFSLEAEPLPGNFPARNRIVAGISDGCFIVQAARQSGAKITAHFALAQGKELFVLPGLFDDPLSEGCHDLIKEGAEVVTSAQTFCEVFELGADSASMSEQLPEPPAADDARAQVLAACREPRDIDELTVSLSIEFCELQQLLLTLQIEGSIEQNMIGQWSTIR